MRHNPNQDHPAVHSNELAAPTAQQAGSQAQDTALMMAARTGNTTIIQALLNPLPSAALNHPNPQAPTALMHAAHTGNTAIIQNLLNPPVTPNSLHLAG